MSKFINNVNNNKAIRKDLVQYVRYYPISADGTWIVFGVCSPDFSDTNGFTFGTFPTKEAAEKLYKKVVHELGK